MFKIIRGLFVIENDPFDLNKFLLGLFELPRLIERQRLRVSQFRLFFPRHARPGLFARPDILVNAVEIILGLLQVRENTIHFLEPGFRRDKILRVIRCQRLAVNKLSLFAHDAHLFKLFALFVDGFLAALGLDQEFDILVNACQVIAGRFIIRYARIDLKELFLGFDQAACLVKTDGVFIGLIRFIDGLVELFFFFLAAGQLRFPRLALLLKLLLHFFGRGSIPGSLINAAQVFTRGLVIGINTLDLVKPVLGLGGKLFLEQGNGRLINEFSLVLDLVQFALLAQFHGLAPVFGGLLLIENLLPALFLQLALTLQGYLLLFILDIILDAGHIGARGLKIRNDPIHFLKFITRLDILALVIQLNGLIIDLLRLLAQLLLALVFLLLDLLAPKLFFAQARDLFFLLLAVDLFLLFFQVQMF